MTHSTIDREQLAATIESALAPRPAWAIRARYGNGMLVGSLPAGMARTPDEAIAAFRRIALRPLPDDIRAFPR